MASSLGNDDGDHGFQIAPMVDVVFVLMLFFMATAITKMHEIYLPADLPSERPGYLRDIPLVVAISAEGVVTMNDFVYGLPGDKALHALREKLQSLQDPETHVIKDPVILRPANDARQERVMDVLHACSVVKTKNLAFN